MPESVTYVPGMDRYLCARKHIQEHGTRLDASQHFLAGDFSQGRIFFVGPIVLGRVGVLRAVGIFDGPIFTIDDGLRE
jgi:hypothetical protein